MNDINELILYLTVMDVEFCCVKYNNIINLRIFLDGDSVELL